MKIAMVSMMNEEFYIAYIAFMNSLLDSNAWILEAKIPFIIIDLGISDEIKDKMLVDYPYLEFRTPNYDLYKQVNFSKTADVLKCTYYKLDTFGYDDCDRIIFIDLDTTIIGDISELFESTEPFSACFGFSLPGDSLRADINSGVFVVNKPLISNETYRGMITLAQQGFSMPDQKVINLYFRGKINPLPKKYNCEKRMIRSKNFANVWNDKVIIHWISEKPWQPNKLHHSNQGFEDLEKIWWHYYLNGLNSQREGDE